MHCVTLLLQTLNLLYIRKAWSTEKGLWATTWQNQQNDCAPSKDSDHPGHPPSLIRVFAVRMKKAWVLSYQFSAQWRLWSDCPGWSESSLGAHSSCWFVPLRFICSFIGKPRSLFSWVLVLNPANNCFASDIMLTYLRSTTTCHIWTHFGPLRFIHQWTRQTFTWRYA